MRRKIYTDDSYEPLGLKYTDDRSGVLVSTVLLKIDHSDLGGNYETCIFDESKRIGNQVGTAPCEVVERYRTIDEARKGHDKWVGRVARDGYAAVRSEP